MTSVLGAQLKSCIQL